MLCKICTSTSVTMYTQKVKGYTLRANIYKNRKLKKPNDFMICKFLAGDQDVKLYHAGLNSLCLEYKYKRKFLLRFNVHFQL